MKILIMSLGTRGDIEPFLFIGELMKKNGHDVICAFPEQFRSLTSKAGLDFHSLGPEFIDMVQSPEGKKIMGKSGSGFLKILAYLKFFKKNRPITDQIARRQYEIVNRLSPGRIIHSGLTLYPFIWQRRHRFQAILVLPVPYLIYPFKKHAYLLFDGDYGPVINKLTYQITNYTVAREIKRLAKTLNIYLPVSSIKFAKSLLTHKTIYTISPSLFSDLNYPTARVLGFHERNKTNHWKPSEKLLSFISQHDRILFISFGSMITESPDKITKIILSILEKNNIPAILNIASGGLFQPDLYNKNLIYFVREIPYEYILPSMHGIIHHGGSGHTHAGLKHGCSTLILPHIFDQGTYNRMVANLGLGPRGIPISRISEGSLAPLILDLFTNQSYKSNAGNISQKMKGEELENELYQFIVQGAD